MSSLPLFSLASYVLIALEKIDSFLSGSRYTGLFSSEN